MIKLAAAWLSRSRYCVSGCVGFGITSVNIKRVSPSDVSRVSREITFQYATSPKAFPPQDGTTKSSHLSEVDLSAFVEVISSRRNTLSASPVTRYSRVASPIFLARCHARELIELIDSYANMWSRTKWGRERRRRDWRSRRDADVPLSGQLVSPLASKASRDIASSSSAVSIYDAATSRTSREQRKPRGQSCVQFSRMTRTRGGEGEGGIIVAESVGNSGANYNSTVDERICQASRRRRRANGIKGSSLCCLTNFVNSRDSPRRSRVSEHELAPGDLLPKAGRYPERGYGRPSPLQRT